MQQEKKGLFGRLLDFWKEKTEEAGGGIGFWSGGKTEGKTTAENRQDALPQEKAEKKPFFWEETVRTAKEKKAEEAETFGQERRRSFAEEKTEEAKGPALRTAEESTQERKTIVPIFTAEIFREKTEWREAEERRKMIFMQEAPFAEQEKRKTIPIVAETGLAEKAAAAEEAEELPQEAPKKEREQAKGAEIDIERLMREMTNRHRGTAGVRESDARLRHHAQQTLCFVVANLHDPWRDLEARESTRGNPKDVAGRAGRTIPGPPARDALRVHGQPALLRSGTRPDRSLAHGRVAQEE